nr:uncharacterized protein LOC113820015 isoform X2 [Penaeus vannamei]
MKSLVILIAVLAASEAAPQGHGGIRFTQKEYNGLQQALGYRVPVGIYSANQVFSMVEEYPTDYIVLNLPGLSAGGGSGYASRSGVAQARTGALPADDEVAETFSEVAEEAVEAVEEAAEEAAEVSINRNLLVQEAVLAMQEQQSAASAGDLVESRSSSLPAADALNSETEIPSVAAVDTASAPVETAVRSTGVEAPAAPSTATETETAPETMATSAATVTEAATESEATATDTAVQPAAAGLAADVDEAVAAVQDVAAVADSVRTKRQETELTAADELSFALAGLGSLIARQH